MEEQKSEETLLRVALKKRGRGDTYRSIDAYLKNNCDDPALRSKIIKAIDDLEESGQLEIEEDKFVVGKSMLNTILAPLLILAGIVLGIFLWDEGYIATLPLIMVGAGVTIMMQDN